jgi:hypothetical protein
MPRSVPLAAQLTKKGQSGRLASQGRNDLKGGRNMHQRREGRKRWAARTLATGTALGLLLWLPACYPGDPTSVTQLDVVITTPYSTVIFGSFTNYAMPDSVVHIGNDSIIEDIIDLPRTFDDLILETVADNMETLGYEREDDPLNNGADLVLLVAAVGVENTDYWYYGGWWGYWGYYPGWGYWGGYPGYGWYYPPYYGGSVTYEVGTLMLFLVDPDAYDPEQDAIGVVWAGAVRGLLTSNPTSVRVIDGIDQAFTQSPYLGN